MLEALVCLDHELQFHQLGLCHYITYYDNPHSRVEKNPLDSGLKKTTHPEQDLTMCDKVFEETQKHNVEG